MIDCNWYWQVPWIKRYMAWATVDVLVPGVIFTILANEGISRDDEKMKDVAWYFAAMTFVGFMAATYMMTQVMQGWANEMERPPRFADFYRDEEAARLVVEMPQVSEEGGEGAPDVGADVAEVSTPYQQMAEPRRVFSKIVFGWFGTTKRAVNDTEATTVGSGPTHSQPQQEEETKEHKEPSFMWGRRQSRDTTLDQPLTPGGGDSAASRAAYAEV